MIITKQKNLCAKKVKIASVIYADGLRSGTRTKRKEKLPASANRHARMFPKRRTSDSRRYKTSARSLYEAYMDIYCECVSIFSSRREMK
jgi:hypothetical protein